MALSTRVWGAGKWLLVGGALVLTFFLFAAASMRLALKTREAIVPQLNGKTVTEAGAILVAAGLNLKVEEARRVDASVPAGQVINQDPLPGVKTRRERSVKVWVSGGPRAASVPALVGESERVDGPVTRSNEDVAGSGPETPPGQRRRDRLSAVPK